MFHPSRGLQRALFATLVCAAAPPLAAAQMAFDVTNPVPSHAEAATCALSDHDKGEVWLRVIASRKFDDDVARPMLRLLQDSLSREADAWPSDIDVQYELALVMGRRAEIEGGTEKIRTANGLERQAQAVLALAPTHPGAQHILGRLHASVLRMNALTRFVATRLLGGGRLGDASWDEARAMLESAAENDPCVPDHHYELARLYQERGDLELAGRHLERLFLVAGSRDLYADIVRKGRELSEEMARDGRTPGKNRVGRGRG